MQRGHAPGTNAVWRRLSHFRNVLSHQILTARPEPDTPVRLRSAPSTHTALSDLRCSESEFFGGFQEMLLQI
jgi:hypothetical protein